MGNGNEISGHFVAEVPSETILGEGSYGKVWRAKDRRNDTWYAVKNIKVRRQSANNIALRECEVAEHIRVRPHVCIVQLIHVHHFREACLYSLVMEFCPDGDLNDKVKAARQEASHKNRD